MSARVWSICILVAVLLIAAVLKAAAVAALVLRDYEAFDEIEDI